MNSIYIHIPFCKSVCYYCDFHFTVSFKHKDSLVKALITELHYRKEYLNDGTIESIYFGGGTPSVLMPQELELLLNKIYSGYKVSSNAEITIEVNPNDITVNYLQSLLKIGFNRVSIGIQSFFDDDLLWMNRRHNAKEAENSVKLCQDNGFSNLNIDLLYGLPNKSESHLAENLKIFNSLQIPHLSAYHLTIENKTVFGYRKRKGTLSETEEDKSLEEYNILTKELKKSGYVHYEISNFCKDSFFSKHNLNYWNKGKYIGIGPSAHSYDGKSRRWNVSVNTKYINSIEKNEKYYEEELLTENEHFNDYLLTGLRTMWGIDTSIIKETFGEKFLTHLEKELLPFINSDSLVVNNKKIILTEKGMFISDRIISSLFVV